MAVETFTRARPVGTVVGKTTSHPRAPNPMDKDIAPMVVASAAKAVDPKEDPIAVPNPTT
jgi:hypothetical protein